MRVCRFSRSAKLRGGQGGEMLVHICAADDWQLAQGRGEHRPDSLEAAGFIHLSTPEQVHLPANRLYEGRLDLVLLRIDPDRCRSML